MPDHLHFIVFLQDGQLTRLLARYKPAVTVKLYNLSSQAGRQKECDWLTAKGHRELWQDGKYSLPLYSRQWIDEKLNYIHNNPVRCGFVENPADYLWSSFVAYHPELNREPPVPVDVNCEC
jgi:hypothetical protein